MFWIQDMMHYCFPAPIFSLFLCLVLVFVCLTGDAMLNKVSAAQLGPGKDVIKALIDSSTHALVGFFVWAIVENSSLLTDCSKWLNCVAAAVLAASVDVDHFLAAGSMNLKYALSLGKQRAPFHNTSIVVVVTLAGVLLRKWRPKMWIFAMMFLCSWLSHHIRDANRRGLWFSPFGHTPIFSTQVYIMCILVLAACARVIVAGSSTPKDTEFLFSISSL